jgi:hypothetical protein
MNGGKGSNFCLFLTKLLFPQTAYFIFISKQYCKYINKHFGYFFHKLVKCLLGFFNPTFSFIVVTKLNALDRILFGAQLDPRCLREEGAAPVRPPAHRSQSLSHSAVAPHSGFSTKFPGCKLHNCISIIFLKTNKHAL